MGEFAKKLGVTYSLFSGEELLKNSILCIRKYVDYINVVWQDTSWTGEQTSSNLEKLLEELLNEGIIDKAIKFDFKYNLNIKSQVEDFVCQKKNLGIEDLKNKKCTHALLMDVDEFYDGAEFLRAKKYIYANDITHSACSIYDYGILPIYRERDIKNYSVPFIFKLKEDSRVNGINEMPCYVDALRVFPFSPQKDRFYYLNMICMHHMTRLRIDYMLKMRSTISNYSESGKEAIRRYSEQQESMEKMTEEEILMNGFIKVEDKFGLLDQWINIKSNMGEI